MGTGFLSRFLMVGILICAWQVTHAQISPIKMEKVDSLISLQPKPILVLLSTDWCQYCAMQKNQIGKNKKFTAKADLFYFVDFDSEQKEPVTFANKTYHFKPKGVNTGTHDLAIALNGSPKISYPSWVLLDHQYNPLFRHNGLLNPSQINELVKAIESAF